MIIYAFFTHHTKRPNFGPGPGIEAKLCNTLSRNNRIPGQGSQTPIHNHNLQASLQNGHLKILKTQETRDKQPVTCASEGN